MPQWAVVVPTIRPESFKKFLAAWTPLFEKHHVHLYVVQDTAESWEIELPVSHEGMAWRITVRDHNDIPDFIPRGTDMIRSWGFYQAWKDGAAYTLSLDDDVLPNWMGPKEPFAEYERVFKSGAPLSDYLDVGALTNFDGQMRGFPFKDRKLAPVGLQAGGWSGVLDYDAVTQIANPTCTLPKLFDSVTVLPVPRGAAVTVCAMNMAFQTSLTPIMWQLPLVDGKYNRFGDIWAGLFAKRVLDAIGEVVVVNGRAVVWHDRASNAFANLEREAPGLPINEKLWAASRIGASGEMSLMNLYRIVTSCVASCFPWEYAVEFRRRRDEWLALFA